VFVVLPALLAFLPLGAIAGGEWSSTTWDFGTITLGRTVSHPFTLRNPGAKPLQIESIQFSQPGMKSTAKAVIDPGASSDIVIDWKPEGARGRIEGTAVVRTADPDGVETELTLSGEVRLPVDIDPFGPVYLSEFAGEKKSAALRLVNNEKAPLAIRSLQPGASWFTASATDVEPGKVSRIEVVPASDLAPGSYDSSLLIATTSEFAKSLSIDVHVLVHPDLYATTESVDFGEVRSGTSDGNLGASRQTLLVVARQKTATVESFGSDSPAVHVAMDPAGKDGTFRFDVDLAAEGLPRGDFLAAIRIKMSNLPGGQLSVPVRASVR
jgi:hypothetical protein